MDSQAIFLSLRLAALTTLLLLALGLPLAWWLATSRSRLTVWVHALVALPLVLPPTVLGFYLLLAFSPTGPVGGLLAALGLPGLAFSFGGLLLASMLYSLPFVVQPLAQGFGQLQPEPLEAAATLGAGPLDRFFTIALPMAWRGVLSAAVLGFAHTLGEFGVVLMIGGNIPGATRVLSIALYDHVEALEYGQAHALAAGLLLFSLVVLGLLYTVLRQDRERRP